MRCQKCDKNTDTKEALMKEGRKTIFGQYCHRCRLEALKVSARIRRQWSTHPEKMQARKDLATAVKDGDVIRPSCCSQCGRKGAIDAHHKDYTRPLDVVWLCRQCHTVVHAATGTGPSTKQPARAPATPTEITIPPLKEPRFVNDSEGFRSALCGSGMYKCDEMDCDKCLFAPINIEAFVIWYDKQDGGSIVAQRRNHEL